MAFHYASDMTLDELDSFIDSHRESMRLSAADEIALHLRRQRRAYLFGRERPAMPFVRQSLRVLLLGDETEAKLSLATLLHGDAERNMNPLLELGIGDAVFVAGEDNEVACGADGTESNALHVDICVPSTSDTAASLRAELCVACDVIVVCFDADDLPRALSAVRQRWWKAEAAPAFAALAKDTKDAKELRRHGQVAWPVVPVIVAGLRHKSSAVTQAQTEALRLAEEMGASKYMELNIGSPHHAAALRTQCVQLAATVAQSVSKSAAEFVAAAKDSALRLHLRVPPPRAIIDTAGRQLCVSVIPGITYSVTIDDSDPHTACAVSHTPNPDHTFTPRVHCRKSSSRVGARVISVPSDGLVDLHPLRLAPGTVLRLSGHARCAYASSAVHLTVPSATHTPAAYVDVALRRFAVIPEDMSHRHCGVRYTMDGSVPTASSALYAGPIALDTTGTEACEAWRPWRSAAPPPRVVRIAAFAEDEFPSAVVSHTVPAVLDTPRIVYTAQGSTFHLDAATVSPFLEYRYTLDGTTPTTTSPLYSGPVSLSATAARQIRVVAFPVVFFPSREAVFYLPTLAAQKQENPNNSAFHTTRTVMMRGEYAARKQRSLSLNKERSKEQQERQRQSSRDERSMKRIASTPPPHPSSSHSSLSASVRRGAPTLRTQLRAAATASRHSSRQVRDESIVSCGNEESEGKSCAQTPRRPLSARGGEYLLSSSPSLQVRTPRAASTRHRTTAAHTNKTRLKNSERHERKSETRRRTGELGEPSEDALWENPMGARCTADGNIMLFDFPESISLAHITVTTPGGGAGPLSYDVEAKHAHGNGFMTVGSGELRDISGVQTLNVFLSARSFPIDRVRCVFSGGSEGKEASKGFRVENIKVHGRPFTES